LSEDIDTASVSESNNDDDTHHYMGVKVPTLRRLAELSLYFNLFITPIKLVAYLQTFSLIISEALLDSVGRGLAACIELYRAAQLFAAIFRPLSSGCGSIGAGELDVCGTHGEWHRSKC
jgi:hypothetical protein